MATKQKTSKKASAPKEEEVPKVRFNTLVVNGVKYKTLLTEKYKFNDGSITSYISNH